MPSGADVATERRVKRVSREYIFCELLGERWRADWLGDRNERENERSGMIC